MYARTDAEVDRYMTAREYSLALREAIAARRCLQRWGALLSREARAVFAHGRGGYRGPVQVMLRGKWTRAYRAVQTMAEELGISAPEFARRLCELGCASIAGQPLPQLWSGAPKGSPNAGNASMPQAASNED